GQQVPHALQPGALLVVALDHGPRRVRGVGVEEHRLLGVGVVVPAVQRGEVGGESFHCRTGSTCRMMNRVCCSRRDTENQNLTRWMPERTSIRSSSGAWRMNSRYSLRVQYPMTRSTPARLYQDRSNSTISPAAGRCAT